MITESAPMKPHEIARGTYVCVRDCRHSPHITIRSDGVWVRSPDPDPLNRLHAGMLAAAPMQMH